MKRASIASLVSATALVALRAAPPAALRPEQTLDRRSIANLEYSKHLKPSTISTAQQP
ncbi:MAG TPA: hypothetical protein VGY57_01295 [Vicinamibacterales bacterium]|jgi:hypothetical protein|nr:hypothetical protein [Vicinamibacterales bacterium]